MAFMGKAPPITLNPWDPPTARTSFAGAVVVIGVLTIEGKPGEPPPPPQADKKVAMSSDIRNVMMRMVKVCG